MKKIGIIGSRRRNTKHDFMKVTRALSKIYEEGDVLVSGGCPKGGDNFAEVIAKDKGYSILIHYPNWNKFKKAAGFVRNSLIANDSDILIACMIEGSRGTQDTINKFCKRINKEIKKISNNTLVQPDDFIEQGILILV